MGGFNDEAFHDEMIPITKKNHPWVKSYLRKSYVIELKTLLFNKNTINIIVSVTQHTL